MTPEKIEIAIAEAKRFIQRAQLAKHAFSRHSYSAVNTGGHYWSNDDTKATAAARRASMDLTRALADVRRFGGVLEHPDGSRAWGFFGLNKPPRIMFTLGDRQMKFTVPLVMTYDGPERGGNGRVIDQQAWLEQRNRQKGRALMLVIKAKLESVESGVETFEQAFLANIVTLGGQTVYERIREPLRLEYSEGKVQPLMLSGPAHRDEGREG